LIAALDTLDLQKTFVIHAGYKTFPLHERNTTIAARRLLDDLP